MKELVEEVNMGTLRDVTQKIKGKAQQVKGNVEQSTGHETRGFWSKTKGKINETVADLKLNKHRSAYYRE